MHCLIKFSYLRGRNYPYQPSRSYLTKLIKISLQQPYSLVQLSISIVDKMQSQTLNKLYRKKDSPTNVISLEYPKNRKRFNLLSGELILCDEIIVNEAKEQNKDIIAHYSHMIIHGLLHLQGYDHIHDDEAETMEEVEIGLLARLGIANPYIPSL